MARPVYSARLLAGSSVSGSVLSFTAPTGFTTVVRDMTFSEAFEAAGAASATVLLVSDTLEVVIAIPQLTAAVPSALWAGRLVMNEGEELQFIGAGLARVDVTVSGYLLSDP